VGTSEKGLPACDVGVRPARCRTSFFSITLSVEIEWQEMRLMSSVTLFALESSLWHNGALRVLAIHCRQLSYDS